MTKFFADTLLFPTVVPTLALVIVGAYWLIVVVAGIDVGTSQSEPHEVLFGYRRLGLDGGPVLLVTTPLIALVWMLCLLGSFAVDRYAGHGPMTTVLGVAVLITSIVLAVIFTRAVVVPRCHTEPNARR